MRKLRKIDDDFEEDDDLDFDDDDDRPELDFDVFGSSSRVEADSATFDNLEPKIRAGEYIPKPDDPWTAHFLYNSLKQRGVI